MASPVYGTGLAGYMQMLAGQARGMNEAERMRRMQEQQDFGNSMRMLGFEDQMQSRELARQDAFNWNAYNADVNQQKMGMGYDFDVYDRAIGRDNEMWKRDYQSDIQDRLANQAGMRHTEEMAKIALRGMPKPQKPLKPGELQDQMEENEFLVNELVNAREEARRGGTAGIRAEQKIKQIVAQKPELAEQVDDLPVDETWGQWFERQRRVLPAVYLELTGQNPRLPGETMEDAMNRITGAGSAAGYQRGLSPSKTRRYQDPELNRMLMEHDLQSLINEAQTRGR